MADDNDSKSQQREGPSILATILVGTGVLVLANVITDHVREARWRRRLREAYERAELEGEG